MDKEKTPGFDELVNELVCYCTPHAAYTIFADNAVTDFYGMQTDPVKVLFGQTESYPSAPEDIAIKERIYKWVLTYPSLVINIKTYTNRVDPVTHELIKEIRGYMVGYKEGRITFKKAPSNDMLEIFSIDLSTGLRKNLTPDYLFP